MADPLAGGGKPMPQAVLDEIHRLMDAVSDGGIMDHGDFEDLCAIAMREQARIDAEIVDNMVCGHFVQIAIRKAAGIE